MNAAVSLLLHGVDKCLTFTCNFTFTDVSWKHYHDRSVVGS
jgi:hypothetical protein